jgi:hypothetical protein
MGQHVMSHERKAKCHPMRWESRDGWCKQCEPVEPVVRMGVDQCPDSCPKCHVSEPAWRRGETYGKCCSCGHDWYQRVEITFR